MILLYTELLQYKLNSCSSCSSSLCEELINQKFIKGLPTVDVSDVLLPVTKKYFLV